MKAILYDSSFHKSSRRDNQESIGFLVPYLLAKCFHLPLARAKLWDFFLQAIVAINSWCGFVIR